MAGVSAARQATRWPPVGTVVSLRPRKAGSPFDAARQRSLRAALAVAALTSRLRSLAHALARRVLLAAGWLAAGAARRRASTLEGWRAFTLRRWHLLVGGLVGLKLLRLGLSVLKGLLFQRQERRERAQLRQQILEASTYSEWSRCAVRLDELTGRGCAAAAANPAVRQTQDRLERRAAALARMRREGDWFALMSTLRMDYLRQTGAYCASCLMEAATACPVVPQPVQRYIDEVCESLRHIADCEDMPLEERQSFLRELRHAYGRTGLVLSGGGSFGFWHFGVVRALLESNLLPRVVSGSSAGSIGGSLLCTRTDEELKGIIDVFYRMDGLDFFRNTSPANIMRHLVTKGFLQDVEFFQGRLRRLLGDLTFLDAYTRTGRILSIAVTAFDTKEPSRLLNYLTAPNVLIWSAVACSSAFPFLFEPQDLLARDASGNFVKFTETGAAQSQRRWCDGSLEEDLPMRGLGHMFNCNLFLVSQCNPWLIPLVSLRDAMPRWLGSVFENEVKHRCQQLLRFFPLQPLFRLLAQPWTGDISFVLGVNVFHPKKSAANLTEMEIYRAMQEGQRAVWAKLPAIQAACAIEVCIDEQLQRVTHAVRQRRALEKAVAQRQRRALTGSSSRVRASLPSWLHIPSLGLPPSDSLLSMPSVPSLGPADVSTVAAAAEGTAGPASWVDDGMLSTAPSSPSLSPRHPPSRLRHAVSGSRSSGSVEGSRHGGSREGSRHGGGAAALELGVPLATPEQQAAEDGVQATAGAIAVAGIEVAAVALEELEERSAIATPASFGEPAAAAGAAADAHLSAPFEGPSEVWRDLALLSGIAAAGDKPSLSLDVFEY